MAKMTTKPCIEACRAAALASHSAAGLVTSMRKAAGADAVQFGEVARLLRSAEALARAAVAALTNMASQARTSSPERIDGGGGAATPAAKSKRRRNKKKKVPEPEVLPFLEATGQMEIDAASTTPSLVQAAPPTGATDSGVSSTAMGNSGTYAFYPVGTAVVLHGLASRTDLEGKIGSVISTSSSAEERVGIQLPRGEKVRVKHQNLRPSLFSGGFG